MKQTILSINILMIVFVLVGTGCEKQILETDPSKIILGKWEITAMGNYPGLEPVENPLGYREYLLDSVLRIYNYETGTSDYRLYWIDSLLHGRVYHSGKLVLRYEYRYNFTENNSELHLNRIDFYAMSNDFIYKRIK